MNLRLLTKDDPPDIRPFDIDVCDWLDANPGVKAVVDGVLEEYFRAVRMHPIFSDDDAVHAAAIVAEEAGELVKAANDVYWEDDVVSRANMHVEANQVGAMAIRFLEHIGNLKGKQYE